MFKHKASRKVSLIAALFIITTTILIFTPSFANATITGDSPPSSGDWIINTDTVVKDEYIIWNSSILIQGSANVKFINTTIAFNTTTPENIWATTTGKVSFSNCTLTAYDHTDPLYYPYSIDISSSVSEFVMNDTIMEYSGSSFEWNLLIKSPAKIRNNIFRNNYYGMYLVGIDGVTNNQAIIQGNTFIGSTEYDIRANKYWNITMEENTFLGSPISWGAGYRIENCNNVTFKKNLVNNGVYQFTNHLFNNVTMLIIRGNEFVGQDAEVTLINCTNGGIAYNVFNGSTYSLKLQDSKWLSSIEYNTFIDCYTGVYLVNCSDCNVMYSEFEDMGHSAVQIRTNSECNAMYNTIEGSDEYGIFMYYSSGTISYNNIIDCAHQGILVQNCDAPTISDNIVQDCGWSGIDIYNSDDFYCEDNIVKDSGRNGIQIESTNEGTVTGNNCTGNQQSGLTVKSSTTISIYENRFCHNYREGVYVTAGSDNISLDNNRICYNEGSGVLVDDGSSADLRNNEIKMNGEGNVNDGSIDWAEILKWVGIVAIALVFEFIVIKVVKKRTAK